MIFPRVLFIHFLILSPECFVWGQSDERVFQEDVATAWHQRADSHRLSVEFDEIRSSLRIAAGKEQPASPDYVTKVIKHKVTIDGKSVLHEASPLDTPGAANTKSQHSSWSPLARQTLFRPLFIAYAPVESVAATLGMDDFELLESSKRFNGMGLTVVRKEVGGGRSNQFWLAPDFSYLPIRYLSRDNGKTSISMAITYIKSASNTYPELKSWSWKYYDEDGTLQISCKCEVTLFEREEPTSDSAKPTSDK